MELSIKNSAITCLLIFMIRAGIAQTFVDGLLWVNIADSSAKAVTDSTSGSDALNSVFSTYNVYSYKQKLSFAKSAALRSIYEIQCNCNASDLQGELAKEFPTLFSNVEQRPVPIALSAYDPSNNYWQTTLGGCSGTGTPYTEDWLWYLLKIQADKAWDITQGDPTLKVALVDNQIDVNHPDLVGKLTSTNDFYTNSPLTINTSMPEGFHGTTTGTILAAKTYAQGLPFQGGMCSVGFNTKIMFAGFSGGSAACLYASTTLGARIISISWFYSCSSNQTDLMIEQEINDNGTAIIKAAGDGNTAQFCYGVPLYPFSGVEDPRTIVVSSTDFNDYHNNITPWVDCSGTTNPIDVATQSHYPAVDLCAPGYSIFGGIPVSGTNWPYFGQFGGTSFSAPMVAGVAALMLACNPSLDNVDVQAILKQNTDPITDAASYPGLVGTGRVNAYKAVLAACTPCSTNVTLSGASINNEDDRYSNDITSTANVASGITTNYKAGTLVDLQDGFHATAGSSFHAYIGNCLYDGSGMRHASQQQGNTTGKGSTSAGSKATIVNSKLGNNIKLGIFPNPTTGTVYLNLSAQSAGSLLVNISDVNGKQLLHNSFDANVGANSFKVDLSSLNQGVYFINVTDENGVTIKNDKLMLMPN